MSEIKFKSQFASRKVQEDKVFQKIIIGEKTQPMANFECEKYKTQNQQKGYLDNKIQSKTHALNYKFKENNETVLSRHDPQILKQIDANSYNKYAPSKSQSQIKNYDFKQNSIENDFQYINFNQKNQQKQNLSIVPQKSGGLKNLQYQQFEPLKTFDKININKSVCEKQNDYFYNKQYDIDKSIAQKSVNNKQLESKYFQKEKFAFEKNQFDEKLLLKEHKAKSENQQKMQVYDGYTEYYSQGCDFNGQLGHGQEPSKHNRKKMISKPKSLSFDILIKSVNCGASFTMILSRQGELFSIGSNEYGQLGLNDRKLNFSTAPLLVQEIHKKKIQIQQIACGQNHCVVLAQNGQMYSWGSNNFGQCGIGGLEQNDDSSQSFSKSLTELQKIYAPQRVFSEVFSHQKIKDIQCGQSFTGFLTEKGYVYTFGDNSEGQLGIGKKNILQCNEPKKVVCEDKIVQFSLGHQHMLLLNFVGKVLGAGRNKEYQLSITPQNCPETNIWSPLRISTIKENDIVKVIAGGFSAAIFKEFDGNHIIVWGRGEFGTFQKPQKLMMQNVNFIDLKIGKYSTQSFAIALDSTGKVYSWGENGMGQLGHGDFLNKSVPSQIEAINRKKITQIAVGDSFIVMLGKDVSFQEQELKKLKRKNTQQQNQKTKEEDIRSNSQTTPSHYEYSFKRGRSENMKKKEMFSSNLENQLLDDQNKVVKEKSVSPLSKCLATNKESFIEKEKQNDFLRNDKFQRNAVFEQKNDEMTGYKVKGSAHLAEKLKFMDQIEDLNRQLECFKKQIEQKCDEILDLKQEIKIQRQEADQSQALHQQKDFKIREIQNQFELLQEEYEQKQKKLKKENKDLSEQLDDAALKNHKLLKMIKQKQQEFDSYQKDNQQIKDLKNQIAKLENIVDELQEENRKMNDFINRKMLDRADGFQQQVKEYLGQSQILQGNDLNSKSFNGAEQRDRRSPQKQFSQRDDFRNNFSGQKQPNLENDQFQSRYAQEINQNVSDRKKMNQGIFHLSNKKRETNESKSSCPPFLDTVGNINFRPKEFSIQQQTFGQKYDNKTRSMPRYSKLNKISSSDYLNDIDDQENINQRKFESRTMKDNHSEYYRYRQNQNLQEEGEVYIRNIGSYKNGRDQNSQVESSEQRAEGARTYQPSPKRNNKPEIQNDFIDNDVQYPKLVLAGRSNYQATGSHSRMEQEQNNMMALRQNDHISVNEYAKSLRASQAYIDTGSIGNRQQAMQPSSGGYKNSENNLTNSLSNTDRRNSAQRALKSQGRQKKRNNSPLRKDIMSLHTPSQRMTSEHGKRSKSRKQYVELPENTDQTDAEIVQRVDLAEDDADDIQSQIQQKLSKIQEIFNGKNRDSDNYEKDDDDGSYLEKATHSPYGHE